MLDRWHREMSMVSHWTEEFEVFFGKINDCSSHALSVVKHAVNGFLEARGTQAAASIAYYAFFSIFPLLVALIVVGSYFLQQDQIRTEV